MQAIRRSAVAVCVCMLIGGSAPGQSDENKTLDFPPLDKVTAGYTEVKTDDGKTFYKVWKNDKTGQMIAQLPKNFETGRQFIAPTIAGGETFAGLQSDAFYVYWKQFGKRVALIQENLSIKGSDDESKASVIDCLPTVSWSVSQF